MIRIKILMFLTLIWWNFELLLFQIFLLSFCLLVAFPLLIFVTSSLNSLCLFVFFFQYFFSLPFHSGSFYGDILNSKIISLAMSSLLISPSKALFISSIVFFISSFSFQFFLRFFMSLLHRLSFSAFCLFDSLEP